MKDMDLMTALSNLNYIKLMETSSKAYKFLAKNLFDSLSDALDSYYQWGYYDDGDGDSDNDINYSADNIRTAINQVKNIFIALDDKKNVAQVNKVAKFFKQTYQEARSGSDKSINDMNKAESLSVVVD